MLIKILNISLLFQQYKYKNFICIYKIFIEKFSRNF
nr:MAG TPA: hypothetical protein [Caudoviricetes sp.]